MGRISPHSSGFHPMPFTGSSFHPMPSGGAAQHPMQGPPRSGQPDPQLALALRRSRSAVVDDGDAGDRQSPLTEKVSRAAKQAEKRWDSSIRTDLIYTELLSRLAFVDGAWYHLNVGDAAADGTISVQATPLYAASSPADRVWLAQANRVLAVVDQREDRLPEIVAQAGSLWPFWSAVTYIDSSNAPRTFELLQATYALATTVVLRLKHELAAPRPVDVSYAVQPVAGTPGHGSLPSGHATVAAMDAELLSLLLGATAAVRGPAQNGTAALLRRLAHRIAQNRVVAGLHYPMDGMAGRLLGETLAAYMAWRCTGEPHPFERAEFLGDRIGEEGGPPAGFDPGDIRPADLTPGEHACRLGVAPVLARHDPSPALTRLWKAAETELTDLGFRR